jgi:hypothetical protein
MYLYNIIAQGEHETLEFKYEINKPRKIAQALEAFVNTKELVSRLPFKMSSLREELLYFINFLFLK